MTVATKTDPAIDRWFNVLECLLKRTPLKTSTGELRIASSSEFMLMEFGEFNAHFKHNNTRNYVFVKANNRTIYLDIPQDTDAPFFRGLFDAFP